MAQDMVAALRFARAELTALERDEHVAEWIRLAENVRLKLRQNSAPEAATAKGGQRAASAKRRESWALRRGRSLNRPMAQQDATERGPELS